jgi:hypothetical protein
MHRVRTREKEARKMSTTSRSEFRVPLWKREIIDNHPTFRRWYARALGKWTGLPAPLPLEYVGRVIRSEHLSIDNAQAKQRGKIVEWYQRFLPQLEDTIIHHEKVRTLAYALLQAGEPVLTLHFSPIPQNATSPVGLTTLFTGLDEETESQKKTLYNHIYSFTKEFVKETPPPMRMWCLLDINNRLLWYAA